MKIIRIFAAAFLVAAFLYGFFLTNQHLARHIWQDGFKNGLDAAVVVCSNRQLYIPPAGETQAKMHGSYELEGHEGLRHRQTGVGS